MNSKEITVKDFFEIFTGGNHNVATWTPSAIMDFAEDYHKKKLLAHPPLTDTSNTVEAKTCFNCNGAGQVDIADWFGPCKTCNGSGVLTTTLSTTKQIVSSDNKEKIKDRNHSLAIFIIKMSADQYNKAGEFIKQGELLNSVSKLEVLSNTKYISSEEIEKLVDKYILEDKPEFQALAKMRLTTDFTWLLSNLPTPGENQEEYFKEFEVIDGLNQHSLGINFEEWLLKSQENKAELSDKEVQYELARIICINMEVRDSELRIWDTVRKIQEFTSTLSNKEWISVDTKLPLCYETGDWDGKRSDLVLIEDIKEKLFIARVYLGFIDGSDFNDWYDNDGFDIKYKVVRWTELPSY